MKMSAMKKLLIVPIILLHSVYGNGQTRDEIKLLVEQVVDDFLKADKKASTSANSVVNTLKTNPYVQPVQLTGMAKNAKSSCDAAMFYYSDYTIPEGIPDSTASKFKSIKENLSQKNSYGAMALGMMILYIEKGDESYFNGYLDDMQKSTEYGQRALAQMLPIISQYEIKLNQ